MDLSRKELISIIRKRDPRYDGVFYFAVKTTKIFCRPICSARPKEENIIILRSKAEALFKGYRPCKRCHSDLTPSSLGIQKEANIVNKAFHIIEKSSSTLNINKLAQSLDITPRHLRRIFTNELGISPKKVIDSNKLLLAKQLLAGSRLSITQIALQSGYNSLRTFNNSFKQNFHSSPSTFRKKQKINKNELIFTINIKGQYDWNYIIAHINNHLMSGQEEIKNKHYIRYEKINNSSFYKVDISKNKDKIVILTQDLPLKLVQSTINKVLRFFDLYHNSAYLPKMNKGIRVLRSYNRFEVIVSIIIGQLVSLKQAKSTLQKLIQKVGSKIKDKHFFPTPKQVLKHELKDMGLSKQKIHAIKEVAKLFITEDAENILDIDAKYFCDKLQAIKGIGPWTIEMVKMRCFNDTNAYPKTDLILKRAIEENKVNEKNWEGYKSYLTHMLWREIT